MVLLVRKGSILFILTLATRLFLFPVLLKPTDALLCYKCIRANCDIEEPTEEDCTISASNNSKLVAKCSWSFLPAPDATLTILALLEVRDCATAEDYALNNETLGCVDFGTNGEICFCDTDLCNIPSISKLGRSRNLDDSDDSSAAGLTIWFGSVFVGVVVASFYYR